MALRLWLLVPLPLALARADTAATLPVVLGVTVEVTQREGLALAEWHGLLLLVLLHEALLLTLTEAVEDRLPLGEGLQELQWDTETLGVVVHVPAGLPEGVGVRAALGDTGPVALWQLLPVRMGVWLVLEDTVWLPGRRGLHDPSASGAGAASD